MNHIASLSKKEFRPIDWPFDPEFSSKNPCEGLKISGGAIYFLPNSKHFSFTVSCGAASDRSHSGCYFGVNHIKTADDARRDLISRASTF